MSKGVEAGKAYISLGVNAQALEKGLKNAGKKVSAMGKKVSLVGASIAGAGAAVLGPLLAATNAFAASGDKIQKMSLRTGASVESLSALAFAAEQSGTSIDQVGDAMFRTSRRIANAAKTGAGPAARALGILGVDLEKLNSMSADEQFLALADALASVEDEALRNQLGFEIMGDNFKQIKPLMDEGSDGIRKLMGEAGELGRTMSTEDANAAAAFADAMNRVSSVIKGVTTQIGAALAPVITDLANKLSEGGKFVVEFAKNNRSLIVTVAKIAAIVVGVGTAISVLGGILVAVGVSIAALGTVVGAIGSVIAAVFSPVALIVAGVVVAIGAAVVALEHYFGFISAGVKWLGKAFGTVKEIFNKTFGVIVDELQAGNLENAFAIAAEAVELTFLDLGGNMLDWWDEVVSGLASKLKEFVQAFKSSIAFLGDLLKKLDSAYGRIYNKIYDATVGGITSMGGVRTIGGSVGDAWSNDPIRNTNVEGLIDSYITTPEEREEKRRDRELRKRELRERMDARAAARAEKQPKENADLDDLEKLNVNLDLGKNVQKPKSASLSDSVGGTFSAFAAQVLGEYRWEEKMLKVAEKTSQSSAEIAKNTAQPVIGQFA